MSENPRGLDPNQEIDREKSAVDIRPWKDKFKEKLEKPETFLTYSGFILGTMIIFPYLSELIFLGLLFFIGYVKKIDFLLPFRAPISSKVLDMNFVSKKIKPDPKKHMGKAISYFGNETKSQKELWFENDDLRTHILIFGSTGAGKALKLTESIHTPNGWVQNKDLQIGDKVSTPTGVANVIGIYPQGVLELYKITFEDGRSIEVSGDHLWEIHNKDFPVASLSDTVQGRAKVMKTEALSALIEQGISVPLSNEVFKNPSNQNIYAYEYGRNLIINNLKQLPVAGHYIEASVEQRYNLIRGFLNTIAYVENNQIIFEHDNLIIINSIKEVLHSLGAIVYVKEIGKKYQVTIVHSEAYKLVDNNLKQLLTKNEELQLKIISVEKLNKSEECQCIKISDKRGLFITKDYIVTHNTESLLSLAFNSLVQGSGLIYVDGKGDVGLFSKIFSMARRVGREDDILVINYMTGSRDVLGPQENKLSNTLNPFAQGSSGGLTELLVSLMDDGGGDGMWKGRAISLISAIMMALCHMRDSDGLLLDIDVIREHLILDNIIKLNKRRDLPPNIRQSIRGYLVSLPGFQEGAPKQNETALEQHGYLQMQFTRLLGSLSDTYGYIFKTNLGEVDFKDVVLNRRILVVLLPALEKSSDELANLGKIIVACLKQMMAEGLGNKLEGTHDDVIETRPTKSPTPFVCILDEYGYYSVKGAAVMPAQARSLGFSMIFAGQDYAAFKKGDEKEAESIVANCNIKIFMKLEDPMATYELFEKSVGEGLTTQTTRYQKNKNGGLFGGGYAKDDGVNIESRKRGNLLDLKDQGPGEAHILFKSSLVRATMFYANPKNAKEYRVNYFLKVEPPEVKEIQKLDSSLKDLYNRISDKEHLEEVAEIVDEDDDLVKQIKIALGNHLHLAPTEAACASIALVGTQMKMLLEDDLSSMKQNKEEELANKINIFTEDEEEDDDDEDSGEDDDENERIFLNQKKTAKNFEEIERLSGSPDPKGAAASMIEDLKDASKYPAGGEPEEKEPSEIIDMLKELEDNFDITIQDNE